MLINLKRTLYLGLSALMLISADGLSMNQVQVSAKSKPRVKRQLKQYPNVKIRLKSGKDAANEAPWKAAWNKYTRTHSAYFSTNIISPSLLKHRAHIYGHIGTRANNRSTWNQFFARNKDFAKRSHITYPQYVKLSLSNDNMKAQKSGHIYLLQFPLAYNHLGTRYGHNKDAMRNSEVLADTPLHKFTPHMRKEWHQVAVPVHNRFRVSDSFKQWMHKFNNHPRITLGNTRYEYQDKAFVPKRINGKYGKTYKFNPKTRRYQQVSTKKLTDQATKDYQFLNQLHDQQIQQVVNQIINNPAFTAQTKKICLEVLDNTKVQNPSTTSNDSTNRSNSSNAKQPATAPTSTIADYKQAAKSNQVSKPQQTRLDYMVNTMLKKANSTNNAQNKGLTPNMIRDLFYLNVHGAFQNMNDNQKVDLINQLVRHPNMMNRYLRNFGVNTAVDYTSNPGARADQANRFANNHPNVVKNSNGIITSDSTLSNELSIMQNEIQQLAKDNNINVPNHINF